MEKLPPHTKELQIVQNSMVRVILGLNIADHINMAKERDKIGMFSVNQMAVYHTVMEAYNITNKSASEQLQKKLNKHEGKHSERSAANNDMYVPENPQTVYRFLLYWTKIVQYDTKEDKRSEDNR